MGQMLRWSVWLLCKMLHSGFAEITTEMLGKRTNTASVIAPTVSNTSQFLIEEERPRLLIDKAMQAVPR